MGLFRKADEVVSLLNRAQRLERRGRFQQAIDELTSFNRQRPDTRIERRLVDLRHRAFFEHKATSPFTSWPPRHETIFTDFGTFPEIDRAQLTVEAMWSGVFDQGSLIVRNMLPTADVELLRDCIENTYRSHDRISETGSLDPDDPWFVPFVPGPKSGNVEELSREWYRKSGAELAADSPRGLFNVIDILERNGIVPFIAQYLGERPGLSVRKTSLRRIPKDIDASNGWHQDGRFLGDGIRTVNLWVALTDCGVTAPSMDMVPRRMDHIVPSGTHGAIFEWSVSDLAVLEAVPDTPPQRMHFKAGDAVFFDEMNMHRTGSDKGMTNDRYALEAWFFAPSCYPMDQIPLLV